jgi:hypothetical protein
MSTFCSDIYSSLQYRRARMNRVRALFHDHRTLAILIVALALLVKVLVPQGYMIEKEQKFLSVQICFDGITHKAVQLAIPANGESEENGSGQHGKKDSPCAFSSLSMGSMARADTTLLAIALAFILALDFAPANPVLEGHLSHILPPLRGPPTAA